jgi:aminoglycoside phosphotransferase (APT) family kinase protein
MGKSGGKPALPRWLRSRARPAGARARRRRWGAPARARARFVVDITLADGAELPDRLREQGISPEEVVFKYFWPRYRPPADSGVPSLVKSEHLGLQFERLVAMHREAPASVPLPVASVTSSDGELVGYLLEYVEGETLQALIARGERGRASRHLEAVERTMARLHARSMPHGDLTPANILVADDGRTLLIDPVANPQPGTTVQDELCLKELRELLA